MGVPIQAEGSGDKRVGMWHCREQFWRNVAGACGGRRYLEVWAPAQTAQTQDSHRTPLAQHIAIVEDEPAIAANYRDALERQGFRVSVYGDRGSAAQAMQAQLPDLAIIDVGLGDEIEGGFELCRELRSRSPG